MLPNCYLNKFENFGLGQKKSFVQKVNAKSSLSFPQPGMMKVNMRATTTVSKEDQTKVKRSETQETLWEIFRTDTL